MRDRLALISPNPMCGAVEKLDHALTAPRPKPSCGSCSGAHPRLAVCCAENPGHACFVGHELRPHSDSIATEPDTTVSTDCRVGERRCSLGPSIGCRMSHDAIGFIALTLAQTAQHSGEAVQREWFSAEVRRWISALWRGHRHSCAVSTPCNRRLLRGDGARTQCGAAAWQRNQMHVDGRSGVARRRRPARYGNAAPAASGCTPHRRRRRLWVISVAGEVHLWDRRASGQRLQRRDPK